MKNYKTEITFLYYFVRLFPAKISRNRAAQYAINQEKAFADDQTAIAVISNIYVQFNSLTDGNITPYWESI